MNTALLLVEMASYWKPVPGHLLHPMHQTLVIIYDLAAAALTLA